MKKISIILVSIFCLLLLSGCGDKVEYGDPATNYTTDDFIVYDDEGRPQINLKDKETSAIYLGEITGGQTSKGVKKGDDAVTALSKYTFPRGYVNVDTTGILKNSKPLKSNQELSSLVQENGSGETPYYVTIALDSNFSAVKLSSLPASLPQGIKSETYVMIFVIMEGVIDDVYFTRYLPA